MKQFKAERRSTSDYTVEGFIDHLAYQHNALCDYLEEERLAIQDGTIADFLEKEKCACGKTNTLGAAGVEVGGYTHTVSECTEITQTITLPKPEWWGDMNQIEHYKGYQEALEAASKASGIQFLL